MILFIALALSLQQAEEIALSQNKQIRLAEQEVGQYQSRKTQSVVSWLPEITFASMFVDMQKRQVLFLDRITKKFVMNQFQFNQPIFSSDLIYGMRAASLYLSSTRKDQDIAINDALLQVRLSYYAAVLKAISLKVQEEVIGYLSEALEDEEKKLQAGKSTSFDVNQSKVSLSNSKAEYHTYLKDFKAARNRLVLNLGVNPQTDHSLTLSETTIPLENYPELMGKLDRLQRGIHPLFSEIEIEEQIERARRMRPEVQKSAILAKAAQEELRQQQGKYLPKISAFVDYGYYEPVNGAFFKQQYNFAGGIQLSWNIFDSMKREFRIQEAKCVHKAAQISVEQALDQSAINIRTEIEQIEEAFYMFSSSEEALKLADQAMKDAKIRLIAGTISPLQYRDAARAYAEASRHTAEARYAILQAYFQLQHDVGEGFKK